MLKDITLGQFFPGDSPLHKMDSRMKIFITILFVVMLFLVVKFVGFLSYFVFLMMCIVISKIPFKFVLKGLKPLIFIIVFTGILNIFMTDGKTAFSIPYTPLRATWEGIELALFIIVRLILLIMGTSLLTLTSSPISLTDGIEHLLSPLKKIKLPVHEIAMMMTIAIRFIPTLLEETEKIMKAQTARGADFESGNLLKRAKALVPLLVPLFISAFRRADELAMAMESRCYHGGNGRTRMKQLKLRMADFACLLVSLIFFGFAFFTRYIDFLI